ncbi:MAG: SHOCT domain-containing protein [Chitinophagales bacterium]|nr:SHOCT domain-containing protein [Chitinophagales bacterium]
MYKEQFEKGKKVAEQLRKDKKAQKEASEAEEKVVTEEVVMKAQEEISTNEPEQQSDGNVLDRLRELGQLRDDGIISEEEFQAMKKKLIDNF